MMSSLINKPTLYLSRLAAGNLIWEPLLSGTYLQSVRWRKTRHMPKAPSKANRIRIPTPLDPKEYIYLKEKYREYNLMMDCVRDYFKAEVKRKAEETSEGIATEEQDKIDEAEWQKLLAWNNAENERLRKQREARFAEEHRSIQEQQLEMLMEIEKEEKTKLEQMTEMVKKEIEASKTFITLENMEEAIDAALADKQNYNFNMDRRGKVDLPDDTSWLELKKQLEAMADEEQKLQND